LLVGGPSRWPIDKSWAELVMGDGDVGEMLGKGEGDLPSLNHDTM